MRAADDSDPTVPNNAVRALWVMAASDKEVAHAIPGEPFVALLNSRDWSDRNKGGMLLSQLTAGRDGKLLTLLRGQDFDSLAEMARWGTTGHALPYRMILGHIAGIEENRLERLAQSGMVEEIIAAAQKKR